MISRDGLRPAARVLVAAVSTEERGPEELAPSLIDEVGRSAQEHRILPAVARYLAEAPAIPRGLLPGLRQVRLEQSTRHLAIIGGAIELGRVLDAAGVAWLVAKGPAAACTWPSPELRQYYDLDLYVSRYSFRAAVEALENHGCVEVDRNWPLMQRERRAELALRSPRGIDVDLHWDYAVSRELRSAYRTRFEDLLARRRRIDVGSGRQLWTPDPVDTILLTAFHAAQSGANRLVWLADVRYALLAGRVDLAELVARARAARIQRPVAMVLARTERVLGLPETVLEALEPLFRSAGTWGRVADRLDARTPFPYLTQDEHKGGALYASARPSTLASAGALARNAVRTRAVERAIRRDPSAARKELRDEVPDTVARQAYLEYVGGGQ